VNFAKKSIKKQFFFLSEKMLSSSLLGELFFVFIKKIILKKEDFLHLLAL